MSGVFGEQQQHLDKDIDRAARPDACAMSKKLHDGGPVEPEKAACLLLADSLAFTCTYPGTFFTDGHGWAMQQGRMRGTNHGHHNQINI